MTSKWKIKNIVSLQRMFLNIPSLILPLLLMVFCLSHIWYEGQSGFGLDYYQFWVVGQEVKHTKGINIYSKEL